MTATMADEAYGEARQRERDVILADEECDI